MSRVQLPLAMAQDKPHALRSLSVDTENLQSRSTPSSPQKAQLRAQFRKRSLENPHTQEAEQDSDPVCNTPATASYGRLSRESRRSRTPNSQIGEEKQISMTDESQRVQANPHVSF